MIALGSDHGGFLLKESIKNFLNAKKIEFEDFGTHSEDSVDYPYFAKQVAKSVSTGESEFGIICCGTGIGVSIVANKFKNVRAAVCQDEFCAQMAREHNDANIICLGGRVVNEKLALKLVEVFLSSKFQKGRHKRRVDQIKEIEKGEVL